MTLTEKIKRLALVALVSDDRIMSRIVLKGGNALDLAHKLASRSSLDLDFSISGSFTCAEIAGLGNVMKKLLVETFAAEDLVAFDVDFREVPKPQSPDPLPFWGGYVLTFKVLPKQTHDQLAGDFQALSRQAIAIGPRQEKIFTVEISKCEVTEPKQLSVVDDFNVYVYTPTLIAIEKLRAICQQMPEYRKFVQSSSGSERARDFYDIYFIVSQLHINLSAIENLTLIRTVFDAKKVPLLLLQKVRDYEDFHARGYASLKSTVFEEIQPFEFYFQFVLGIIDDLHSLWKV